MKKKLVAFFLLAGILLIFTVFPTGITAFAAELDNSLGENVLEQIDALDLKALEEYIQSLTGDDLNLAERILEYIKGEPLDYGNFFSQLFQVIFRRLQDLLPSFACILGICLLSGILTSLKSGESIAPSVRFIGFAGALIPTVVIITECYTATKGCIDGIQTQMNLVFPILLTLTTACGGSVTAAVCTPSVAFLSTAIVTLMSSVVLPITLTVICFSLAEGLSDELKLNKFADFFTSLNKWLIGLCVSVFSLVFTVQGITGISYDSVTRRAAKYAIGNGIPIVGGFLSGGFDLAVAGSILIKNSLGTVSIFLLLGVLFEPLVLLICTNVLFKLTAAITAPLGEKRISDFLSNTAKHLNYCSAAAIFTAFMYFLCVLILVCSAETFL